MLTSKELAKLQNLAKIDLASEEREHFSNKLELVIKMLDKLQEVDCSNVQPLRSVCDMKQRFFADEDKHQQATEELFQNVPKQGASLAREVKHFVVPKVIE